MGVLHDGQGLIEGFQGASSLQESKEECDNKDSGDEVADDTKG